MIRINLLPHREIKRQARKQQFIAHAVASFILAALIGAAGHLYFQSVLDAQEARNRFLREENTKLNKEIEEIKALQQQISNLLSRKQVIESLQEHRSETVRLFNELIMTLPEGVSIKTLKQTGQNFAITGYSQSNARVSTLMRNMESATLFNNPQLIEVKSGMLNNRRVAEFSLRVGIKRAAPPSTEEGFGKATPAGAKSGAKPGTTQRK
jgi:type IV pilus assembly protein PilN